MSKENKSMPTGKTRKPSEEFAAYCEAEFERRINSGKDFDESSYREAKGMVMEKLISIEEEGNA